MPEAAQSDLAVSSCASLAICATSEMTTLPASGENSVMCASAPLNHASGSECLTAALAMNDAISS